MLKRKGDQTAPKSRRAACSKGVSGRLCVSALDREKGEGKREKGEGRQALLLERAQLADWTRSHKSPKCTHKICYFRRRSRVPALKPIAKRDHASHSYFFFFQFVFHFILHSAHAISLFILFSPRQGFHLCQAGTKRNQGEQKELKMLESKW